MIINRVQRSIALVKAELWDARLMPVLGIVVLMVMVDFVSRLTVETHDVTALQWRDIEEFEVLQLRESMHTGYLNKLSALTDTSTTEFLPLETHSPSGIDIDAAAGVNIGYWRATQFSFKLLAIIVGDDHFAVFDRVEDTSGEHALVEVRVGDFIDGFLVKKMTVSSVTVFSESSSPTVLQMFQGFNEGD